MLPLTSCGWGRVRWGGGNYFIFILSCSEKELMTTCDHEVRERLVLWGVFVTGRAGVWVCTVLLGYYTGCSMGTG
jgi:hypothetical protein